MTSQDASRTVDTFWIRTTVGISFLLLVVFPSLSIRESFWVDELHSVWVILGEWGEVHSRATVGNQSPCYFYALKGWAGLLGGFSSFDAASEIVLRLSSLVGWGFLCCVVLGKIFRTIPRALVATTLATVVGWLWLDRIGAFYAIELRPYVWVSLACFFVIQAGASVAEEPKRWGGDWVLSATLAFYLHYTSIVVIELSWLGSLVMIAARKGEEEGERRSMFRRRFVDILVLTVLCGPGGWHLRLISEHSGQWASFAGDASWRRLVDMFPWMGWIAVPLALLSVKKLLESLIVFWRARELTVRSEKQRMVSGGRAGISTKRGRNRPSRDPGLVRGEVAWLVQLSMVAAGSLTIAWLVTWLEIAPLMHRRYIMGAYPAIVLLGASLLSKLRDRRWMAIAAILSSLMMIGWQGTLGEWRQGRWMAWQRQEDWRGAIDFLDLHRAWLDPVLLAPMLVETQGARLDERLDRAYLRFPLTSAYPFDDVESIGLLPNDESVWQEGIDRVKATAEGKTVWLIARTRSEWKGEGGECCFRGGGVRVWRFPGR